MSSSLSDVEDQTSSAKACFYVISSKNDNEQIQYNSSPDSSFYVVKNAQQSSSFPSSSRPGNARTLFTVIPPMPQDTATKTNVRCQMVYFFSHKFI
jgi:hypothetical protein